MQWKNYPMHEIMAKEDIEHVRHRAAKQSEGGKLLGSRKQRNTSSVSPFLQVKHLFSPPLLAC